MRVNHLFALAVLLWVGSPGHASPSSDTSIASPHGCEVMAKDLEGMNSLPNTLEVNTERAAKLYAYANRGCGKATEAHKKEFLDSYRQLSAECKRARGRNCDPLNALERPTVQASGANSVPRITAETASRPGALRQMPVAARALSGRPTWNPATSISLLKPEPDKKSMRQSWFLPLADKRRWRGYKLLGRRTAL